MTAQTILPANTLSTGGFQVDNSVRLFSNTLMTMTPSGAPTNADISTLSFWTKIGGLGTNRTPIAAASNGAAVHFRTDDQVDFYNAGGSLRTTQKFKDVSAWYHIVLRTDTTDGTANDRLRVYVNGTQVTDFAARSNPDQNANTHLGSAAEHHIGCNNSAANFFNGYLAEVCFIDGLSLGPDSFGEFDSDSGIWKPIKVSGLTFGKNGFYLEFKSGGNLGDEDKGTQTADWSETNLTAVDQSTDTCTNNFATLNPLLFHTYSGTYSEGNLKIVASNNSWYADASTIAPSSGKFYMEVKVSAIGNYCALGVGAFPFSNVGHSQLIGELSNTIGWRNNGVLNQNGSAGTSLNSFTTDDIIGMYLDLDNGKFYFSKNGTLESSTGLSLTTGLKYFFVVNPRGSTLELNFGSPSFALANTAIADDNGYGAFEYSPNITGDSVAKKFYTLNTKNLAEFGG